MATDFKVILQSNIPKIADGMVREVGQIVRGTAAGVLSRAQTSMQGPKTGLLYPRGGGSIHQASAPGEAPAVDTGALLNSLQMEMQGKWKAAVYTNLEYALVLEYSGANMAARPFMTPAAMAEWDLFIERMRGLERAI